MLCQLLTQTQQRLLSSPKSYRKLRAKRVLIFHSSSSISAIIPRPKFWAQVPRLTLPQEQQERGGNQLPGVHKNCKVVSSRFSVPNLEPKHADTQDESSGISDLNGKWKSPSTPLDVVGRRLLTRCTIAPSSLPLFSERVRLLGHFEERLVLELRGTLPGEHPEPGGSLCAKPAPTNSG